VNVWLCLSTATKCTVLCGIQNLLGWLLQSCFSGHWLSCHRPSSRCGWWHDVYRLSVCICGCVEAFLAGLPLTCDRLMCGVWAVRRQEIIRLTEQITAAAMRGDYDMFSYVLCAESNISYLGFFYLSDLMSRHNFDTVGFVKGRAFTVENICPIFSQVL